MKKLLSIGAALMVAVSIQAQTNTASWIDSPIVTFLQQSNLVAATYGIYDETDNSYGGGVGIGYKLSEFVVPTLRLDYVKGAIFVPSGNLQLQVPIYIRGIQVTPFTFSGIATAFNDHTGDVIGIFGMGGYIAFKEGSAWRPDVIIADYERWTGGGFNDNQYRFGLGWRF